MNRKTFRIPHVLSLALVASLAVACGGGGGGGGMQGGLSATFTASNPTPGANTVSMAQGSASGPTFQVQVLVTDIVDFFGAAFQVTYNQASATFVSFDSSTSLLLGPGDPTDFTVDGSTAGVVLVNASLQGQFQGVTVVGSDVLLTLTFRATSATGANPFDFGGTLEVQTCPAPPGGCSPQVVTWSGGSMRAN